MEEMATILNKEIIEDESDIEKHVRSLNDIELKLMSIAVEIEMKKRFK